MAKSMRPRDEFKAGPVGPHHKRNEWAAVYLFVTEILRFTTRRLQEKPKTLLVFCPESGEAAPFRRRRGYRAHPQFFGDSLSRVEGRPLKKPDYALPLLGLGNMVGLNSDRGD